MKLPVLLWIALVYSFAVGATSEVISLDSGTLDSSIGDGSPWYVEFYAPWCGHCKRLEPTYEEVAIELAGEVKVAKVDSTKNAPLTQRFSVKGFPSIFLIRDGSVYVYKGMRTKEAFVKFAREGFKDVEPMSLFSSPLGPVGRVKGSVYVLGKTVYGFYESYTAKGYNKWIVVGVMTITGVFALVAVIALAVNLAMPADPPLPAERPHQD